jgi:protein-disulfide isomerase
MKAYLCILLLYRKPEKKAKFALYKKNNTLFLPITIIKILSMIQKFILLSLSLLLLSSCMGKEESSSGNDTSKDPTTVQGTVASPTFGAGTNTLTIYADFQCPACIAFNKAIMPIFMEYAQKGQVQLVFKQFPLTSIHKNAERDALAALCSVEQDKYMQYKNALYTLEEKKSGARVSDAERVEAGKGILDTEKLADCIKADKYLTQVRNEVKEGVQAGVTGTPTILFNGKKVDNKLFSNLEATRTVLSRWLAVPTPTPGPTPENPDGTVPNP